MVSLGRLGIYGSGRRIFPLEEHRSLVTPDSRLQLSAEPSPENIDIFRLVCRLEAVADRMLRRPGAKAVVPWQLSKPVIVEQFRFKSGERGLPVVAIPTHYAVNVRIAKECERLEF